ncbi:Cysteine-rich RLK (receptor-like protein kinase) 8 [Cucumis melo var. makuwa]|uniref:Cysteine-rich RLK (Receptor-like protein kinase) 8 n=1 Tax=Cucumis melo var. makuwa TaxID=1194695 RepID=A0A5A7VE66_CUCMM|nr:Cysteine-rich RLK (receptor-like protein kinase) 8 [Cucumis melo var. makuwa]TYK08721.1 Cysteine-rich RLK (receptor-like protein kinase) 8 [Cucumis melo var. makuwa]
MENQSSTNGSRFDPLTAANSQNDAQLNPYFIHHSLGPTAAIVTQPLTGAINYTSWSRAMLMAISGRNKAGFITGKIQKPSDGVLLDAWICNNDILASWILNSVSKEIAASIIYIGSIKEIWDELRQRFKQSNGPSIYQLRKEFVTLRQGNLTIETYYTKLKTIWQNLNEYRFTNDCTCGGLKPFIDHLESEYIMAFLMGLNDSYAAVRAQILLMQPLPSINTVFSLLIQEEQQRSAGILTPPIDPVALNIASSMAISTDRNRKKERPTCSYCGIKGHIADKCYKKHGYPPGYKPRNSNSITTAPDTSKTNNVANTNSAAANRSPDFFSSLNSEQYSQLMTLLNNHLQAATTAPITTATAITHTSGIFALTSHNNQSHDEWIIDSGASRHICHDKSLFKNWSHTNNMFVMLPNGHRISVDLIGDIQINGSLTLKDVLFVSQFAYNLISVSCLLITKNISLDFQSTCCIIQDLSRPMMIGKASCQNGLYVLNKEANTNCIAAGVKINAISVDTWHQRLGHLSPKCLSSLSSTLCLSNHSIHHSSCHVCPLAKQKRLSFHSNNNVASSPFDLVHADIWGPFKIPSYGGYKYFLTLVDDCLRFTWVYMLRQKSDVLHIVPKFFQLIETQFSKVIKSFRSDNAPELKLTEFFAQKGTVHQFSCVEQPQQNSVVERKHQHLLNVARALFFSQEFQSVFGQIAS